MTELTKRCSCGTLYDAALWHALPLGGYMVAGPDDEGPLTITEIRTCALCLSTMGIDHDLGQVLTQLVTRLDAHDRRLEALEAP